MSPSTLTAFGIDLVGELLMVTMLVCNVWRLRGRSHESRLLRMLVCCAMLGCLLDFVATVFDGAPGPTARAIVVGSETLLYSAATITCSCWASFITLHMRGYITPLRRRLLAAPAIVCLALLVGNLFSPLVFHVSAGNVYTRLPFSRVLAGIYYGYFCYALALEAHMRRSTAGLRFFPGWALMFPVAVGGSMQLAFPALPLFWATVSVGIAGTITSLQNEDIYRDRLTGLYNRAFLEYLKNKDGGKTGVEMTGVMIDLNGFKSINDRFGHAMGDQALVDVAHTLRRAVGDIGVTVRYAGDEFVILLNTRDSAVVKRTMTAIRQSFSLFNVDVKRPYQLSASMGQYPLAPGSHSIEEFIETIDRAMYEDKRRYYQEHPEANRRAEGSHRI